MPDEKKNIPAPKPAARKRSAKDNGAAAPGAPEVSTAATVTELRKRPGADQPLTRKSSPQPLQLPDEQLTTQELEEVRRRAYDFYQQRGGQHGSDQDDWYRAEQEVRTRRQKQRSA